VLSFKTYGKLILNIHGRYKRQKINYLKIFENSKIFLYKSSTKYTIRKSNNFLTYNIVILYKSSILLKTSMFSLDLYVSSFFSLSVLYFIVLKNLKKK